MKAIFRFAVNQILCSSGNEAFLKITHQNAAGSSAVEDKLELTAALSSPSFEGKMGLFWHLCLFLSTTLPTYEKKHQ